MRYSNQKTIQINMPRLLERLNNNDELATIFAGKTQPEIDEQIRLEGLEVLEDAVLKGKNARFISLLSYASPALKLAIIQYKDYELFLLAATRDNHEIVDALLEIANISDVRHAMITRNNYENFQSLVSCNRREMFLKLLQELSKEEAQKMLAANSDHDDPDDEEPDDYTIFGLAATDGRPKMLHLLFDIIDLDELNKVFLFYGAPFSVFPRVLTSNDNSMSSIVAPSPASPEDRDDCLLYGLACFADEIEPIARREQLDRLEHIGLTKIQNLQQIYREVLERVYDYLSDNPDPNVRNTRQDNKNLAAKEARRVVNYIISNEANLQKVLDLAIAAIGKSGAVDVYLDDESRKTFPQSMAALIIQQILPPYQEFLGDDARLVGIRDLSRQVLAAHKITVESIFAGVAESKQRIIANRGQGPSSQAPSISETNNPSAENFQHQDKRRKFR